MLLRLVYASWEEAVRALVTQLQAFDQSNTAAIDLKADIASPTLTGTPTAPTATAGTSTTQIATTAFVTTAVTGGALSTGKLFFYSSF